MDFEYYKKIINKLIKSTESGSLKWSKSVIVDKLEVKFNGFTVSIDIIDDNSIQVILPGSETAKLKFLNDDGVEFDKVSCYDFKSPEYLLLSRLYDVARRSANNIDVQLNQLYDSIPD